MWGWLLILVLVPLSTAVILWWRANRRPRGEDPPTKFEKVNRLRMYPPQETRKEWGLH